MANIKVSAQFYDGTHVGFGKNRVQYDYFEWKFYKYPKYRTYFYTGGKELAIYTAKVARKFIKDQENLFEYQLKDKIQFIIYNKHSHFKQSNVGLSHDNGELGGITQIMGSKVYVYFNGNHKDFDRQIKNGITQVIINQQVYGSSWTQVLRNSSLLSLPDWYSKGLTSFFSDNWSPEIENKVRDGIISGKYKKFNRLSDNDAIVAGHSLWAYIINTYGESVIPNILYMTRVTQSIEKGFLYVLGVSMKSLTREWLDYYSKEYKNIPASSKKDYREMELFKIKKRRDYQQFKSSPDGNNFAFVTNQLGQYKIYIYYKDGKNKKYKIYKKEYKLDRIADKSFPVLEWHPSGEILAFVTEEKGVLLMHYFDINTGGIQVKALFKLEKLLSMDYADNGKEMVFSGVYKGQSDLYYYYIGANSHKKLTDDKFDDLSPRFIENSTKIAFTSTRINDSLGYQPTDMELFNQQKDIWILDLSDKKELTRVTDTPKKSEYQPFAIDSMLYYLEEDKKTLTRYSAVKDSFITHIDTAVHYHYFYETEAKNNYYNRNIKEHYIQESGKYTEVLVDDYRYHLVERNLLENESTESNLSFNNNIIDDTDTGKNQSEQSPQLLKSVMIEEDSLQENNIDIFHYVFDKEESKSQRNTLIIGNKKNRNDSIIEEFKLPNQRNYNLSFFNDDSAIKLSNSFVNGEYQSFTGGPFINPGIGAVMKLGTIDLFEDYKISGGIRFSSAAREYFMTYQNFLKRTDKEYTLSRTTFDAVNIFGPVGVSTNTFHYSIKRAISEVLSFRTTASIRNDNQVNKSVNDLTLDIPDFHEFRVIGKAALVFDNTRNKMLNIYYGTKFKLFAEYYQELGDGSFFSTNSSINDNGEIKGRGNGENGNMQVLGFDFRHSQKISRELVWVNRLAGSSSFGFEKLIYYLGSVDDWVPTGGERFINQEDIDFSVNYRYHALAANMRGFPQNIRRGTNFAVFNSELRFPVFKYFIRRPIRSKFVTNFQIIGFTDVGTAWNGFDPWDKSNSITKDIITDGPVSVTVFKNSEPIVAGYGFGLRSTLLGYFIRADWAWGVENGISKDRPIFYLSFSLDI